MRRAASWLAAGFLAAAALSVGAFADQQGAATAQIETARIDVILSHLPLKTSRAYHALRRAGGNAPREVLPVTKSEVWSLAADRLETLSAEAKKTGVVVTKVDEAAMNTLVPAPTGAAMTAKQSEIMQDAMQDKSTMGYSMMALPAPTMLEYALTRGMSAPEHDAPAIVLKLSEGVTVTARRITVTKQADSYVWHGEIDGSGEPVTLLCWPEGRVSGTIQHNGRIYQVQSLGGGLHGVIETAPHMLPPEHAPMDRDLREKMHMQADPLEKKGDAGELMDMMPKRGENLDNLRDLQPTAKVPAHRPHRNSVEAPRQRRNTATPSTTITLIIAYTKAAARHYTDISKDLIALAIAEANQSFNTSGIGNLRLKLVHAYQTGYVEKGTHFEHMFNFAEKGDGIADEIHALRDTHKADVAIMIVDDDNGCGLSAGVAPAASRAFGVVHHGCAAISYSLAHEIGHIIGARHDIAFDDTKEPLAFAHGFVNGRKWRTMMSYEQSCQGCPRLPIWSNPSVNVRGEAAGNESADNARVLREGARRVAAFR